LGLVPVSVFLKFTGAVYLAQVTGLIVLARFHLKLGPAVCPDIAGSAIVVTGSQHKLESKTAGTNDPGGFGADNHARRGRHGTGGDEIPGLFNFDNTDTAGTEANHVISAGVVLGAAGTWSINGSGMLDVSGAISGSYGMTKTGAGTLRLSSDLSDYLGTTTLSAGVLELALPATPELKHPPAGSSSSLMTISKRPTISFPDTKRITNLKSLWRLSEQRNRKWTGTTGSTAISWTATE